MQNSSIPSGTQVVTNDAWERVLRVLTDLMDPPLRSALEGSWVTKCNNSKLTVGVTGKWARDRLHK